jgi:hypothetical protein
LGQLAGYVHTRFGQTVREEDLGEAITFGRESVVLRPPGHPGRSMALGGLALYLHTRFEQMGREEDFDEVIILHREALALQGNHSDRSTHLAYLGHSLYTHFEQTGREEDLDQAMNFLLESRNSVSPLSPMHGQCQSTLADIYLQYHDHNPSKISFLSKAFDVFASCTSHPTSSLKTCFLCALRWAREARKRGHNSTRSAYSACLELLNHISIQFPSLESQHKSFLSSRGFPKSLASDAASYAIDLGDLEAAVEMLELGRGILWQKMKGYRQPLLQLHEVRPDLAEAFQNLGTRLETHAVASKSPDSEAEVTPLRQPTISYDDQQRDYNTLSRKWDQVVEEIRALDGFRDFLRATPFTTLQQAAAGGPVIIVNVSRYRSDVIILRHTDEPVLVPLPKATPGSLAELASRFTNI